MGPKDDIKPKPTPKNDVYVRNLKLIGICVGAVFGLLIVFAVSAFVCVRIKQSRRIKEERRNLPPVPPEEVNLPR